MAYVPHITMPQLTDQHLITTGFQSTAHRRI
nr:MAG TPA: hypothetical protein [Caudoviricetes sp.]